MLASCLEFWAEFLTVGYRQHFRASQFKARDLAIAAYDTADPNVRSNFDRLAVTMSVVLEATGQRWPPICGLRQPWHSSR